MPDEIESLKLAVRRFSEDRDWSQFHSPKNLACALCVEASELLEHFQWLTEDQTRALSEGKKVAIGEELADVFLYLLNLSDKLGIDLAQATWRKMQINGERYPVDRARGSIKKYSEL